jgi:hypothetical protein
MRQIIVDVLQFVEAGDVAPSLQIALSLMGERDLRAICIHLLSWWGRGTLMHSAHPYLLLSSKYPWCQRLSAIVSAIPELRELVEIDEDACRFAGAVTSHECQLINTYVRQHYRPTLRT